MKDIYSHDNEPPKPEFEIVPISKREAYELVEMWSGLRAKMNQPVFMLACVNVDLFVGVALAGMPRALGEDDGWTLEAHLFLHNQLTNENYNVVVGKMLMASSNAAEALGYRRTIIDSSGGCEVIDTERPRDRPRPTVEVRRRERKTDWQEAMGGRRV